MTRSRTPKKTFEPITADTPMSSNALEAVAQDAQDRLRTLFSDAAAGERLRALDHSGELSNLFSGYLSGADDRNPGMRDSVVSRCSSLVNMIQARVPLMPPMAEQQSVGRNPKVPPIGTLTKAFAVVGKDRIIGAMHPRVEQAVNVLIACYAANGYLSGTPGATKEDVASGKAQPVHPFHLEQAIVANNGAVGLALIAAGANPLKCPEKEAHVVSRYGTHMTIKAGDFEGLVMACTKEEWLRKALLKSFTDARAQSMRDVMAAGSLQAVATEHAAAASDKGVYSEVHERAGPSRRRLGM